MEAPFSLRALMAEAEGDEPAGEAVAEAEADEEAARAEADEAEADGEEAAEAEEKPARPVEIDSWKLTYDAQLFAVERVEDDYAVAPAEGFERGEIRVATDAAEYALTLVSDAREQDAPEAEAEEESEAPIVYAAEYDLATVELPLSLPAMMAEANPDGAAEGEAWAVEYDETLLDVDEARDVRPIASFERTAIAVTAETAIYEFTLLNYSEKPTQPALDLGLAVVTPVDETLGFDVEATGTAGLLTEAEAEAAYAAVEGVRSEEAVEETAEENAADATENNIVDTTEENAEDAEAQPDQGKITLQSRTEYQAFNISLENVDATEYEDGFNVIVSLPETIEVSAPQLYHVLEDEAGAVAVEEIAIEDVAADAGTVRAFAFTADSLEARDTYVLSYTVDFYYGEFEFHMDGEGSMLLSELLDALEIDEDAAEADAVVFTDPSLVEVRRERNDWRLTSLKPFLSEETLTVTFENSDIIVIRVTDEQTLQSPYDLAGNAAGWVKNPVLLVETLDGEQIDLTQQSGSTEIPEYASFKINLPFNVSNQGEDNFEGLKQGDQIVYTLPDWVRKLDAESGVLYKTGTQIVVGNWNIDEHNQLVLQLSDSYVNNNPYGGSGEIEISGSMQVTMEEQTGIETKITFLGKTYNAVVKKCDAKQVSVDIEKEHLNTQYENGTRPISANYKLTVKAGDLSDPTHHNKGDVERIVIRDVFTVSEKYSYEDKIEYHQNDTLKPFITYDPASIEWKIYDHLDNVVTDGRKLVIDDASQSDAAIIFKVVNADGTDSVLHPDERVEISYKALFDDEMFEHDPRGPQATKDDATDAFGDTESSPGSSGSEKNAKPIENVTPTPAQDRSWVDRIATNNAQVETTTPGGIQKADPVDNIRFSKTWLWKNGAPKTGFVSDYQISVNENPVMDIGGWVLTDNLATFDQEIISDIYVYEDERQTKPLDHVSLEALQKNENLGNFAGSTTKLIQYTFPTGESDKNYRFFYKAKYIGSDIDSEQKAPSKNGVTLKETGGNGHNDTYGVYESHLTPAATVTKRLDKMDVGNGYIRWQTTIDEGVDVTNGSVYNDWVGWTRSSGLTSDLNTTYLDHTVDKDKLNLSITYGEAETPMTLNEDYRVEMLDKEAIATIPLKNKNTRAGNGAAPYGFRVTFLKDFTGPVLLHYDTQADFFGVTEKEDFKNFMTYQKVPNPTDPWGASASGIFEQDAATTFEVTSSIKKMARWINDEKVEEDEDRETTNSPVIKWHLYVNQKQYVVGGLKIVDTIPAGLEFNPMKDLQVRWIANSANADDSTLEDWLEAFTGNPNAQSNKYPATPVAENLYQEDDEKITTENDYFKVTYTKSSRKLVIELNEHVSGKTVEFNIYTQPKAEVLMDGGEHKFTNTAELFTNTGRPDDKSLGTDSAMVSVQYSFVGKGVVYTEDTAPNAIYSITANEGGIDLNPEGDRYELIDEGEDDSLRFNLPDSLVVRNADTGATLERVSDDEAKLGEKQYRLNIINDHSFKLDVPDNTPLQIEYSAYVPGVLGQEANLNNTITLQATKDISFSEKVERTERIQKIKGNLNDANRVELIKVDAATPSKTLQGAEFKIYQEVSDGDNGIILRDVGDMITNEDGIASSYTPRHIALENFQIYRIVETKAPFGYITPQGNRALVGRFVFVTQEPKSPMSETEYIAWIEALEADGIKIIIQNDTNFRFFMTNAVASTDIVLLKVDETTRGTSNQKVLAGAEFTLYRQSEDAYEVYPDEENCVATSGEDGRLTFEHLPDGNYKIVETKAPPEGGYVLYEVPTIELSIENGIVTWTNEEGQNLVGYDSNSGLFTVGNTAAYTLPSTGGAGTRPYTLGGILLILGAAILLLRRGRGTNL